MSAVQRVKQFYLSIFDKINNDDICFINIYLNDKEKELFYKLSKSEQKHSVRVARSVSESSYVSKELDKDKMVKVALLHDVGKLISRINPMEKSILVLLNLFTKGKLRKYSNFKKIKVFYYHGELGSNILKELGYDEKVLNIIKNHHNLECKDQDVVLLRKFDDEN